METRNHFIYLIALVWKKRIFFMAFNAIVIIISVIYLLSLPNWYRSYVTVLVENKSDGLNLASTISEMVPFGFGNLGQNENVLRYIRLLNSRTISDKVIREFNLKEIYECELMEEVYDALSENTNFIDNEDGSFSIVCYYEESPDLAAAMANFYYRELVNIVAFIDQEQAGAYRKYVEEKYAERREHQKSLEEDLKGYQEKTGIVNLEAQIQTTVNTLATLEIEKIKAEIERDVMRSELQQDNPLLKKYDEIVTIHQNKIDELKVEDSYSNIPYESIPEKGMVYLRLYRDFVIEEKLTEYLALQLEQAKLEESKKSTNLYLLDSGVPSDKKSKPTRSSKLIIITIFSVLLSMIYIKLKDYYDQNKSEYDKYFSE